MSRVGAAEGFPDTPSAREKIGMLLASEEIATSLPEIVGSFTFEQEPDPEKWHPSEVVLREGYDSDPSVILVVLLDYMSAVIASNAAEDYLKGLLRLTGLKPQQARLRFDTDMGDVNLVGTSDQTKLKAETA